MPYLSKSFLQAINKGLALKLDCNIEITDISTNSGESTCQTYKTSCSISNKKLFLKKNIMPRHNIFEEEKYNLEKIQETNSILTPEPLLSGTQANCSFLILEYISIKPSGNEYQLAQRLAKLHRHSNTLYGFERDNFIGNTPQKNTQSSQWLDFWINNRIQPQLALAYKNGYQPQLEKYEKCLLDKTIALLKGHKPQASLLHGDLWSGNKGFTDNGEPIIFDPACYYGDRETDIAMTELFGGFSQTFYQGYNNSWPLPPEYEKRKVLYNLYHQLNHLNLFGSHYLSDCIDAIQSLHTQIHN
ncbi:MAG: fructosamine kinase family protein [Cellvibrionaceae bacterium]